MFGRRPLLDSGTSFWDNPPVRRSIFDASTVYGPRQPSKEPGPPQPKPPEAQAVTGAKGMMLGTVLVTRREDARPGQLIEFRFAMAAIAFPAVATDDIVVALEEAARIVFKESLEKSKLRKNQHMRLDLTVTSPSIEPSKLKTLGHEFERRLNAAPQTKEVKARHE